MFQRLPVLTAALVGLLVAAPGARADVKPHALIGDGMVLQRDGEVPIWGTADDGEKVTVLFEGQEVSTTAADGKWIVRLHQLKAGGPYELTISGKNKLQIKNVLVGEVWICSGQSNMEWPVRASAEPEKTTANSADAKLRLFTVLHKISEQPLAEVNGKWSECGTSTVAGFSAVAYFFGRDLRKALDVPVGLIQTSWGGTPAQAWTSRPTLESSAELRHYLESLVKAKDDYPKAQERHKEALTKHEEAVKKAKEEGKPPPPAPRAPVNPVASPHMPAGLYNGMIEPLLPYRIRGAIWYQGESNAGRAYEYRTLFPAMIQDWRTAWKQGDFPFLFVQLAPFMKIQQEPMESAWAELREAQLLTTKRVPNTGMAVITDVGEENDIHPKKKEPVGARLALAALAIAYGQQVEYSGPAYDAMKVDGDKVALTFKHLGGGLVAKDGPLQGFTLAGEDRKFMNAQAEIQGDKVIVSSDKVAKPVAVRFGWANYPVVNLWNKESLPASPFRTDEFPLTTQPKKPATSTGAQGR